MENDKVCAHVAINGPFWEGENKILRIFWIGTVVTSAGQLWDVRWNGVSVGEDDIRTLWRDGFDLFTKRATQ